MSATSDRVPGMRGVVVGVDVGSVRIGVAAGDARWSLASPVETVARSEDGADLDRILAIAREREALLIVVGDPVSLDGSATAAAALARRFATDLATRAAPDIRVRLVDERLTTVDAHRRLRETGMSGRRQRAVVDQVAAVLILQAVLDAGRDGAAILGEVVRPRRARRQAKGTAAHG